MVLETVDQKSLNKFELYGENLEIAKMFFLGKTYKEIILEEYIQESILVKVVVDLEYTSKSMEESPQYPPGKKTRYFIVAPNKG